METMKLSLLIISLTGVLTQTNSPRNRLLGNPGPAQPFTSHNKFKDGIQIRPALDWFRPDSKFPRSSRSSKRQVSRSSMMEILHPFLLVFIGLMGSFANENLQKKSIIFPVKSSTAYVVAKGMPPHPFINVSMCLRYFTQLTRTYSLVSGATRKNDNEFLLYKPAPNQYNFYVGGDSVSFIVPETLSKDHGGQHICVIWESATGIVEFWVDGSPLPRKGLKKGSSINAELSLILGQEQDSYGGGFDANQSFEGEMSDLYIWDRVLSPKEVAEVRNDQLSSPNPVIDWKSLDYEPKGYVVVKPSLSPW